MGPCIVTGGDGALGAVVVQRLRSLGVPVAIIQRRSSQRADGLVFGGVDLSDASAAAGAIDAAAKALGRLYALVNVAGAFRWETVAGGNIATWDFLYAANVKTAVNASRAALPHLVKNGGGRIVNIGANAATRAAAGMGAYAASKAGVARFTEALADAEPDNERRKTLLQQISTMTVSQRVKFAMKGGSEARRTLIRDTNKVVQRAVLQSPRLTDQEVEAFASMTNLTDEILRMIGKNRNFRKNYNVVRNLMNNGKAPLDVTLGLLPMLNPPDLKKLGMNKNIPETLRATAVKLMRQRNEAKK